MSANSPIEWTHHTFNPWWGCTKVSPGCDNCYAEAIARRFHPGTWGLDGARRVWDDRADGSRKHWNEPYGWDKKAKAAGEHHRVFCASMADVFDKHSAAEDERPKVWSLIHKTPNLDWLLLTKRVGNVVKMVPESWMRCGFPPNVWLGISVVNQEEADRDIPKLLALPARVRFLSCEPLLGRIDLCEHFGMWWNQTMGCFEGFGAKINAGRFADGKGLHWVIAGGESGPKARPMHPSWVRSLRDQCQAAGVPFHYKQHGEWLATEFATDEQADIKAPVAYVSAGGHMHDGSEGVDFFGSDEQIARVGKKAAGRMLDGRTWDEFPARPSMKVRGGHGCAASKRAAKRGKWK